MQPRLFLFIGYPGAGKTTVAKIVETTTGAVHIWADEERHQSFNNPTHSHQESTELYERLNQRTEQLLASGRSVVFDTNFNFYADRQRLRDIASRRGAQTVIIWVNTPLVTAKHRAVHSQEIRNGYSYAMSEAQFDAIANKLEPPHESEIVLKIDGTKLDEAELNRLLQG